MYKLYIGNKNYSSWSMRPWVLLKQAGIPFEEIMVRFDSFEGDVAVGHRPRSSRCDSDARVSHGPMPSAHSRLTADELWLATLGSQRHSVWLRAQGSCRHRRR